METSTARSYVLHYCFWRVMLSEAEGKLSRKNGETNIIQASGNMWGSALKLFIL